MRKEIKGFLIPNEIKAYATFLKNGYANGYAIIPEGHPLHGKDYDYINQFIEVHGGLTFSQFGGDLNNDFWVDIRTKNNIESNDWIIGFDTKHSFSGNMDRGACEDELKSMIKQIENYGNMNIDSIINDLTKLSSDFPQ